jgi:two-component system sensor histidine kinase/response regulator
MNDHVTKPIDPDLLFRALFKWIDPRRLVGRKAPGTVQQAPTVATAPIHLPAIFGVDWNHALAKAGQDHGRLRKRIASFVKEYQDAPDTIRASLAAGDMAPIQAMSHNLKSSASYLGAASLAAHAASVEQQLREGQAEGARPEAEELARALAYLLAGLAPLDAPAAATPYEAGEAARLLRELAGHLRADDARAEDVLHELKRMLTEPDHAAPLAAIQQAVDDIEYDAALEPLEGLARTMDVSLEND